MSHLYLEVQSSFVTIVVQFLSQFFSSSTTGVLTRDGKTVQLVCLSLLLAVAVLALRIASVL